MFGLAEMRRGLAKGLIDLPGFLVELGGIRRELKRDRPDDLGH
jgi:hypothetical protein